MDNERRKQQFVSSPRTMNLRVNEFTNAATTAPRDRTRKRDERERESYDDETR